MSYGWAWGGTSSVSVGWGWGGGTSSECRVGLGRRYILCECRVGLGREIHFFTIVPTRDK